MAFPSISKLPNPNIDAENYIPFRDLDQVNYCEKDVLPIAAFPK
jgi:hypothetical protein